MARPRRIPLVDRTHHVAKARIIVTVGGERWYLFSRKRSDSTGKHDKLEMLGGHLDDDESPTEALARELREEEATGTLADLAAQEPPPYVEREAGGATHYLFALEISEPDYTRLEADPSESLGYVLVRESELDAGQHRDRLTPRTRAILDAFGPAAQP